MKPLNDMTDAERERANPPYRWLQWGLLVVGVGGVILFSGEIIAVLVIGVVATFKG